MSQLTLFGPDPAAANKAKVDALDRKRKSKPLARKSDPSSSRTAGGRQYVIREKA